MDDEDEAGGTNAKEGSSTLGRNDFTYLVVIFARVSLINLSPNTVRSLVDISRIRFINNSESLLRVPPNSSDGDLRVANIAFLLPLLKYDKGFFLKTV